MTRLQEALANVFLNYGYDFPPRRAEQIAESVRAALADEANVAVETLTLVIAQLRENHYHDWPTMLERDVLPALSHEAEVTRSR